MPVLLQPKCLRDLAINSFCNIVIQMLTRGVHMTERTDDAVQVAEDKIEEVFAKRATSTDTNTSSESNSALSDAKNATLDLLTVKQMVEKHGDFPSSFVKYIKDLPSGILNVIFERVLNNFFKVVGAYHEDHVELFMDEKWSFPPRIRVAFRILLRCLLSTKISTFNMNRLTNEYFKLFGKYLIKTSLYKDKEYMNELNDKNREVFINTIIGFKDDLTALTSISMQNLADGELLWLICCQCPNLWHLDLSGAMFDLRRYSVFEVAAGTYVTVIDNGVRQFEEAEFVDALCGLYGDNNNHRSLKYDGFAKGCFYLRTLLLPDCIWEAGEESVLVENVLNIFTRLTYLEEVTGVCLLYVLCKVNEVESKPLMLNLKKFDGKTGGHRLVGIDPKRLKRVKLPLVREVIFSLNVFMKPVALEIFPNMQRLTVTPYDTRGFNFENILLYLKNLVSLDIEYFQEISLSHMCILADSCQLLESLSVTCLALCMKENILSENQVNRKESKRVTSPPFVRLDKQKKHEYEPVERTCVMDIFTDYSEILLNTSDVDYDKEDSRVPNFSSLYTLQLFDVIHIDKAVLFKCVKGSPHLQTLTVVVNQLNPEPSEQINDEFIGHLAPSLRWVREVTFAFDKDEITDYCKMKLTNVAVSHLLHFCQNISSISRVGDWDMSLEEIQGLNSYFKKRNYVLRLH